MNWKQIFEAVKSDFCSLMNFKVRGDTLEVQTSFVTLGNQFVSIFISLKNDVFIVSDGGWIDQNYYGDSERDQMEEDIIQRIESQLRYSYKMNQVKAKTGTIFNFKTTSDIKLLSLTAFETAHFVTQMANARLTHYAEDKIPADRQMFVNEVNSILKFEYGSQFSANDSLDAHIGELGNIKFNAIIRRPAKTSLLMYVSGSTHLNFVRSAAVATINFQIANKDWTAKGFNKVAIVNSQAPGYNPERVHDYLRELREETSTDLLDFYKNQPNIVELIAA